MLGIAGDLGQTENTQSTLSHIKESAYDVLILPGDLSYADGDQPRWDSYGTLVSPLASSRPWMVTQGNHEIESFFDIDEFVAYNARWQMPYALSGSNSNLYYSFEVAGVHFLMLGSYADFSQDSDQYKWLQVRLRTTERRPYQTSLACDLSQNLMHFIPSMEPSKCYQ
jgi:3',5'-cyclic AMP phosphodiesterase CpdA